MSLGSYDTKPHAYDVMKKPQGSSQVLMKRASYFHYDGMGSVTNVTDSAGLPQWSYAYDPFGTSRSATKLNPLAPDNPICRVLDGDDVDDRYATSVDEHMVRESNRLPTRWDRDLHS